MDVKILAGYYGVFGSVFPLGVFLPFFSLFLLSFFPLFSASFGYVGLLLFIICYSSCAA